MPQLAERQRDFAAAVLDAALPMPAGLVGPDGEPSLKRFAVYRNNVVAGLTEALKDAFQRCAASSGQNSSKQWHVPML